MTHATQQLARLVVTKAKFKRVYYFSLPKIRNISFLYVDYINE